MSMPGFELYKKRQHLSVTSICRLARCPKHFFFSKGLNLQLPSEYRDRAFLFGSGIHKAVSKSHRGDLDGAMVDFMEIWGDEEGDMKRNPGVARSLLKRFVDMHSGGEGIYELIPPPKGTEIEQDTSIDEVPFVIDVGIPVPVVGRIDAVSKHRHTGELWGIEYKTASQMGIVFNDMFYSSPQILTYTLALRLLTGEDWKGFFIEGFLCAKTRTEVLIIPVSVEEYALEQILEWWQFQYDRLRIYEAAGYFPCNFGACTPYDGFGQQGFACEFRDLCMTKDWTTLLGLYEDGGESSFTMKEKENGNENDG